MITEQLEINKNDTGPDEIKDIEIHQYKFPTSTLYIKGTTKDDAKIDISGTYNYTSFDGIHWCYNKSDTEEIKIKYFMYDGYVFYNNVVEVDLTEVSITYETNQFENNIVPSVNYLVHNYAKLTKLDEYATLTNLDDYYTKGAADEKFVDEDELATTLNECVNKDKVIIDGFMKMVELEIDTGGSLSFAAQLYHDENIRQAAIDRGLYIDAYLNSDSSVIFKGHFDYIKRESNKLYFSNGTQTIYTNPYDYASDCCRFYDTNGGNPLMLNRISVIIVSDEYTNNYANNIPSMKYINNNYATLTKLEEYQLKSNTTNTHYCPIEESLNKIDDFVVGAPVYLTGKVYKYDRATKQFISSTESDTTDCICSVKTNGKWNEFVGICTSKDDKCITFATHGDYLVRVTDTSCYGIGDEVFVDAGELKTLTGQTAVTSKIRRTTVGIITAKISDTMLAIFKS